MIKISVGKRVNTSNRFEAGLVTFQSNRSSPISPDPYLLVVVEPIYVLPAH